MRRALVLAYDGRRFHGSALQPHVATVAGSLVRGLELLRVDMSEFAMAGRTDAGVHARSQVISFASADVRDGTWPRLHALLADGIMLRSVVLVPPEFHARHSACWRQYLYRIRRGSHDPLFPSAWQLTDELDRGAMAELAAYLLTVDDFDALCKVNSAGGYRRRIHAIDVIERAGMIDISVLGVSFCHQMVRRIVGALVRVGRGRASVSQVAHAVEMHNRGLLSELAPPGGLYLWRVGYSEEWAWAPSLLRERGFEQDWATIGRLELDFPLEWSAECPSD
ncbi:tRNA pseudouridine(38-40) synthase TruA [Ferrimicrobium acidiphilum]|uniref:tRNA pseudouridine synthase A n=1 Tax=Ferrimicrobium acidiphilum TaxID=121039 RepID=A0ABV3Y0L4_9ACTN|nr:tRNA pseudouridine(38-40) synthase TruA [Actinomycetota bacterium]